MSPKPCDLTGPLCLYVCITFGMYILPTIDTKFYFCVLRVTYAGHVLKMASLLSAEYAIF